MSLSEEEGEIDDDEGTIKDSISISTNNSSVVSGKRKRNSKHATKDIAQTKQKRSHKRSKPKFVYVCKLCGVAGHHVSECPKPNPDALVLPEGYICNLCKQPGHHIRFCTQSASFRASQLKQQTPPDSEQPSPTSTDSKKQAPIDTDSPEFRNSTLFKIFGTDLPDAVIEMGSLISDVAKPGSRLDDLLMISNLPGAPEENDQKFEIKGRIAINSSYLFLYDPNVQEDKEFAFGVKPRKTKLCRFFRSRLCTRGSECIFSHDLSSEPCAFHNLPELGGCAKGNACPFSHAELDEAVLQVMKDEHQGFVEAKEAIRNPKSNIDNRELPEWLHQLSSVTPPDADQTSQTVPQQTENILSGLYQDTQEKAKVSSQPAKIFGLGDILTAIPGALCSKS
ncbi:hypothetical protein HDU97_007475 [Phlyctochytrium planicorne]|nr:hypothetical protein HDU97_007475 [Phlyctochytrium planicorne]